MQKSNDKIPKSEWRLAQKMAERGLANQKFAALDPASKRVAIAKDVLKWLTTGKIFARTGVYLIAPAKVEDRINGYKCEGCALGSLFACAVEHGEAGGTVRRGEGDVSTWRTPHSFEANRVADTWFSNGLYAKLTGIFTTEQLVAIEAAFEGNGLPPESYRLAGAARNIEGLWENVPALVTASLGWYQRNVGLNDEKRMRKIMKNIIRNKGTFVPEQD